jgi:hypothetical protein
MRHSADCDSYPAIRKLRRHAPRALLHPGARFRPGKSKQSGRPHHPGRTIATPESLQDARIRYRAGANEMGSYEYHRWEERPGAMVRDSLVRALRASGKYRRVLESSSSAIGDYLLRGKLYEFAEVDNPAIQTRNIVSISN